MKSHEGPAADERPRRHIDETFDRFTGRRPPPSAYKQALFPEGSRLIPNPLGTAMSALLELDEVLFATLPGVPAEMHRMFEEALEPTIRERSEGVIVSLMLKFAGISEEEVGEKVQDLIRRLMPGRYGPWQTCFDRASIAGGATAPGIASWLMRRPSATRSGMWRGR